ncbi:MAG: PilW family protein [Burkholderiaceae bacterium]|nr:PilW family protein [Burkholderiaceae bacterium]
MSQLRLPSPTRTRRPARGVSLIELMIAITVGMFVILAVTTVFTNSSRSHAELQRNAAQIENGRYAIEILSEEIQMAGFWGPYATASDIPTLPLMCATASADLGWDVATLNMPVAIFGYDGNVALRAGETCFAERLTTGTLAPDVIAVRRVETVALAPTAADDTSAFLQVSNCNTDPSAMPFIFSQKDGDFTLRKRDCTTREDIRRYRTRAFYIGTCSNCSSADGLPSLRVAELDGVNKIINNSTLVEGIENLKVEYGLDNDGDGQVDVYSTCSEATCDAAAWRNVVTVRLHVLSRTAEASPGYVDEKKYDMGAGGSVGPFNDAFKRHVYTAVVRAANPAGRRERP